MFFYALVLTLRFKFVQNSTIKRCYFCSIFFLILKFPSIWKWIQICCFFLSKWCQQLNAKIFNWASRYEDWYKNTYLQLWQTKMIAKISCSAHIRLMPFSFHFYNKMQKILHEKNVRLTAYCLLLQQNK